MADSTMSIIAIIVAVIIMGGLPLIAMANHADETSNLAAQTATTDFVNDIRTKGVLDLESYNNYLSTLTATGNTYNTEIVLQIANGNLLKKENSSGTEIGSNVYITKYTTQVLEELHNSPGGKITLNEGDIISVTAENTNITIAQQLRNFFYKVTGNTTDTINAEATGMVTTTGN